MSVGEPSTNGEAPSGDASSDALVRELPASKEEGLRIAKEHGWQEQMPDSVAMDSGAFSGEWFANPVVYEYNGDEGDIGPKVEALEKMLFDNELRILPGEYLKEYDVNTESEGPSLPGVVIKVCGRSLCCKSHLTVVTV
jgi:hypothetical protein